MLTMMQPPPNATRRLALLSCCFSIRHSPFLLIVQGKGATALISRVVPVAELVDEAVRAADKIASLSWPVTMMITQSVNRSYEGALAEGLLSERRALHAAANT